MRRFVRKASPLQCQRWWHSPAAPTEIVQKLPLRKLLGCCRDTAVCCGERLQGGWRPPMRDEDMLHGCLQTHRVHTPIQQVVSWMVSQLTYKQSQKHNLYTQCCQSPNSPNHSVPPVAPVTTTVSATSILVMYSVCSSSSYVSSSCSTNNLSCDG